MVSTHPRDEVAPGQPSMLYAGRVAWTKGESNHDVANLLCDDPVRITGDFDTACVDENVDLVVSKRFPRSDLVSSVVPVGFDPDAVTSVVVAVGPGPHTPLAVTIAEKVADTLGIPGLAIAAYRGARDEAEARTRLEHLAESGSTFETKAMRTPDPRSIADDLSAETLLVHGAAGGSFIERHFTGTGTRLTSRARGCVLVVRSSAAKCFQAAEDPTAFALAPELLVADALQVMAYPFAPVVSAHRLLGIVRVESLIKADPGSPIAPSVEAVTPLGWKDPLRVATFSREHFGPGPLPVVDDDGHLVGVITG